MKTHEDGKRITTSLSAAAPSASPSETDTTSTSPTPPGPPIAPYQSVKTLSTSCRTVIRSAGCTAEVLEAEEVEEGGRGVIRRRA